MTRELSPIEVPAEGLRKVVTALDALRAAILRDYEMAVDWGTYRSLIVEPAKPTVRDRLKRAGVPVDFDMIWRTR